VACSTHKRCEIHTKFLIGKPEGKEHLEDEHVDERVITEWIIKK
jgi:hypothetical protein